MAATRTARTHWEGSLKEGSGQTTFESSGLGTYDVTWASRAEEANGKTSPEELLAAAHATCFSMALSLALADGGTPPSSLDTTASVTFQPGKGITGIELQVTGKVPGMSADQFREAAEAAKDGCPVSQALKAVPMTVSSNFQE
jgi:lipoyl-dependent peroxiredoxin